MSIKKTYQVGDFYIYKGKSIGLFLRELFDGKVVELYQSNLPEVILYLYPELGLRYRLENATETSRKQTVEMLAHFWKLGN